ncbi:hypothetical protein [uncultured Vagococcus sp.]|uniref:hypothetical protein n=1 Tax=uncultured Vagococcus sp. TaxID=189676 RepID=UPI0028D19366|nr:hypothetical protein [uncultured Vagococcus sp.]
MQEGIVTTHSPFIMRSLKERELIKLTSSEESISVSGEDYVDQSIEEISENVMGIEGVQRSKQYNEMYETAIEYYKLLEEGLVADKREEKKRIELALDKIEIMYDDNPAYTALLAMKRIANKSQGGV